MNSTLFAYLQLMRAPAVFTAVSNILAAHLVVTGGDIRWFELLALMAASASLYSAGMVLNDWFDYQEDLITRPERPLTSGRIPRSHALILGLILLLAGCAFAALVGVTALLISLLIALLVLLYDGRWKRTVLGAPAMGACRYFNWLLGLSIAIPFEQGWWMPLPVFFYIVALTLLSGDEEHATHRATLLPVMVFMMLAMTALALIAVSVVPHPAWPVLIVALAALHLSSGMLRLYRDYAVSEIQKRMSELILFIIPLDVLMALSLGAGWWSLAPLALLPLGRLLARVMYVT